MTNQRKRKSEAKCKAYTNIYLVYCEELWKQAGKKTCTILKRNSYCSRNFLNVHQLINVTFIFSSAINRIYLILVYVERLKLEEITR